MRNKHKNKSLSMKTTQISARVLDCEPGEKATFMWGVKEDCHF